MNYIEAKIYMAFPLDRDTESLTEAILDDLGDAAVASAGTYHPDRTEMSVLLDCSQGQAATLAELDQVLRLHLGEREYETTIVKGASC